MIFSLLEMINGLQSLLSFFIDQETLIRDFKCNQLIFWFCFWNCEFKISKADWKFSIAGFSLLLFLIFIKKTDTLTGHLISFSLFACHQGIFNCEKNGIKTSGFHFSFYFRKLNKIHDLSACTCFLNLLNDWIAFNQTFPFPGE